MDTVPTKNCSVKNFINDPNLTKELKKLLKRRNVIF